MRCFLPVVVLLSLGLVLAEDFTSDFVKNAFSEICQFLENDDFRSLYVAGPDGAARKRRSAGGFGGFGGFGGYGGNNYVGNYLNTDRVGHGFHDNNGYGRPNVNFIQSFHPGKVQIEKNHIVHNYYKQGNYQKALQYFYAIPLVKVASVNNGMQGHFQRRKSYTVTVCQKCHQGRPQIEVRCNTKPYNYLVRRFVFQPQINNVNYNQYNQYSLQEHPNYNQHPSYDVGHPGYNLGYDGGYFTGDSGFRGYYANNNQVNQANFAPNH
ncbi:hypothetical protein LOTGIDRAFT_232893 [Lottia gigantea]|uniref:Uncharacterized protein n=1 Tax=Lottia gigantea TaxID=225164 RepID=V4ACB8_LOTGI|nr:hypothetical protein LOTGIDRAFT_232893 [Lottia gigantea]ESO92750.1 hypothetical protein LOTGIDRAFT_232893 [Lottia gigantea]